MYWKKISDINILEFFDFNIDENKKGTKYRRANNSNIKVVKDTLKYYNEQYCSTILQFKIKEKKEEKEEFSEVDKLNYFKVDNSSKGKYIIKFNNLCSVMNKLIPEKILEFNLTHDNLKRCPICNKQFETNTKQKYCSKKCAKKAKNGCKKNWVTPFFSFSSFFIKCH